jgi:type II secretory pathway component GspD/PulD (secretin)
MNVPYATAVIVASFTLATPLLAQQQQRQQGQQQQQQNPGAPQARPAAAPPPPAAEMPSVPPPSAAQLESQRRRDEQSVDLDELLTHVSQATGTQFLVDPRVRLRVYGVPRIDNPTYAELLTILRMHGFVAVEVGGRVNIVPDALARFLPVRLLNRDDDSVPDDEFVTRVITTSNAVGLVPVLRPLMSQAGHLAAVAGDENEAGQLILMDTYANIRRMTELINALSR